MKIVINRETKNEEPSFYVKIHNRSWRIRIPSEIDNPQDQNKLIYLILNTLKSHLDILGFIEFQEFMDNNPEWEIIR